MTIQLNPEQEQVVGRAIQAGLIRTFDDVAEVGLATIRQKLSAQRSSAGSLNAEEWSRDLTTWIERHGSATPLLSDEAVERDSIYGARGQ